MGGLSAASIPKSINKESKMTDKQFEKISNKFDLILRSNLMISYMLKRLIHHIDKDALDTQHEDWDEINSVFRETETMINLD